ncbi:replication factor C subunit 1 [Cichlidogyrus casuarinus]|uniref:Replication factor C subunit 1 n=1 Tax=Cichlidogyrus casuarinus TaxID=1844966 RepID=A0ABD2QGN5_9PLAT
MPKAKRPRVVLEESDSEHEENAIDQDEHSKPRAGKKSSKFKKMPGIKRLFYDKNYIDQKQIKIDSCFTKLATPAVSKANKIENYFQKKLNKSPKESNKEITADDFFSTTCNEFSEKKAFKEVNETPIKNKPQDQYLTKPKSTPEKPLSDGIIVPETPITPPHLKNSPQTPRKSNKFDESMLESPTANRHLIGTPKAKPVTPKPVESAHKSYWSYKTREGPRFKGEKQIPKGKPGCLKGFTFVFTGVLDFVEREDAQTLIENCDGRVTKALSKKTNYLVTGREPGESKLSKAKALGTDILEEDQLYALICSKSGEKLDETADEDDDMLASISLQPSNTINKDALKPNKLITGQPLVRNSFDSSPRKRSLGTIDHVAPSKKANLSCSSSEFPVSVEPVLWVDKYKPTTRKGLVGQNGEKSPTNKLFAWLESWHQNLASGAKEKAYNSAPPWGSSASDDGKWARAVLLSGPPGIGKTTSAQVVCLELGFASVELNASDARSKRLMQEELVDSLSTHDISSFAHGKKHGIKKGRHLLIMDEVDGMSGNQDRGGMQELIQMIKQTKIPVICLCNDRQSPKIRSLANYCLDLRFQRPRVEQIKAAIMTIVFREKCSISGSILNQIIESSNHDIRQTVNMVQLWCTNSGGSCEANEESLKAGALAARKDLQIGPFEVIRKVFQPDLAGANGRTATFPEMMDLFFQDYSFGPMFVQDNYLKVKPRHVKEGSLEHLQRLAEASNDIATGDIVSHKIHKAGTGSWSLLPIQSIFSSVSPGILLSGSLPGGPMGVTFPAWFGKNSTQNKNKRLLGQISNHMRISTDCGAADSRALVLDYIDPMARCWSQLLKEGDIETTMASLVDYKLMKEDFDSIMEVTSWPGKPAKIAGIDSKVKAALTRTYNKTSILLPYAPVAEKIVSSKGGAQNLNIDDEDNLLMADDVDSPKEDQELDSTITVKKIAKNKEKPEKKAIKPKAEKKKSSRSK